MSQYWSEIFYTYVKVKTPLFIRLAVGACSQFLGIQNLYRFSRVYLRQFCSYNTFVSKLCCNWYRTEAARCRAKRNKLVSRGWYVCVGINNIWHNTIQIMYSVLFVFYTVWFSHLENFFSVLICRLMCFVITL